MAPSYHIPGEFVSNGGVKGGTFSPRMATSVTSTVASVPASRPALYAPAAPAKTYVSVGEPPFTPFLEDTRPAEWPTKRVYLADPGVQNYTIYPPVRKGVLDSVVDFCRNIGVRTTPKPTEVVEYVAAPSPRPLIIQQLPSVVPAPVPQPAAVQPAQPIYLVPVQAPLAPVATPTLPPPPCLGACRPSEPTVMLPDPEKMLCFGHRGDERTLLCGMVTLPPPQIKYDIVVEKTQDCLGLCERDSFVAVCRKCRMRLANCPYCHKQSVTSHP